MKTETEMGEAAAVADPLDPTAIREWAAALPGQVPTAAPGLAYSSIRVQLSPRFAETDAVGPWRVVPLARDTVVDWVDVAGYVLGTSEPLPAWAALNPGAFDFLLSAPDGVVEPTPYL